MGDIGPVAERSLICAKNLEEWVGETSVKVQDWQQGWNPRVRKDPKGVVLIIACVGFFVSILAILVLCVTVCFGIQNLWLLPICVCVSMCTGQLC